MLVFMHRPLLRELCIINHNNNNLIFLGKFVKYVCLLESSHNELHVKLAQFYYNIYTEYQGLFDSLSVSAIFHRSDLPVPATCTLRLPLIRESSASVSKPYCFGSFSHEHVLSMTYIAVAIVTCEELRGPGRMQRNMVLANLSDSKPRDETPVGTFT